MQVVKRKQQTGAYRSACTNTPFLDTIGLHDHLLPIADIYRSSNRYNYKHVMWQLHNSAQEATKVLHPRPWFHAIKK